jgi:acyl-CoA synthetase (AMP-forming)/AMP-acid ligase II/thioesterase domain-containing protein
MPSGSVAAPKFSPVNRSIVERIVSRAITHGDSVAVYDGATKLTYKELISWAAALSKEIGALRDPESPVGILLPSSAAYIVAILALLIAGRTSVPMNDSHSEQRNRRIVGRSGLGAVIVDSETAPFMREIAPTVRQVPASTPRTPLAAQYPPRTVGSPDRIVMISFTSGTTDEPKGVVGSEKWLPEHFVPELALTSDDRTVILESVSARISIALALKSLFFGAQVGIIDLKCLGLSTTRRLLGQFRPTVYSMVPSMFRVLFGPDDAEIADLGRDVRWVRLTSDLVQHSDVDLYRRRFPKTCQLVVTAGATETGLYAGWCIDHATALDLPLVPVGYPPKGVELELINEDGAAVGHGEIGEIFVTGPALAVGYWQDEALTQARFSPSPKFPGMTRYRTGDLGRFLPSGLLELIGRRDRQVKIRGTMVHLGEVDAVLAGCPNVAEVGVVARQTAEGTVLVAYCTPAAGGAIAEEQVRRWCRDRLPAPMRPTHFFVLAALPRLPNGKLDLIGLAALDAQQPSSGVPIAPLEASATSGLSDIVRQAWTGVLSPESFDADMAFDAAGGDSLKGLELLARLEALLGRDVAAGALGLETRPSELIRRLTPITGADHSADDARPLIALFPGMWGDDISTSDFYRCLSQRFPVMAIDPRLGGDALIGDYDAARYFATAIAAIRRAGPPRRLWLVGYSFGGRLAAETARRLLAAGTAVEAVIVLDGAAVDSWLSAEHEQRRGPMARLRSGPAAHGSVTRYLLNGLVVRVAPFAARRRANRLLRSLLALALRFGSAESYRNASRTVIQLSRRRAFGDRPTGALPMALWLFITDDPMHDRSRPDLGWSDWCQEVHRVSVGGMHRTMLSPPTREVVLAELARLEIALRPKSAGKWAVSENGRSASGETQSDYATAWLASGSPG